MLAQVNAYLAGLQLTLGSGNLDSGYSVEVVVDDRLRDANGTLTSGANGGLNNQQTNLPVVPTTDTFNPYLTTVSGYNLYNVVSNTRPLFISSVNDPAAITASNVTVNEGAATLLLDATTTGKFAIADSDDNGAANLSATVTVTAGTITAVGGAGGSVAGTGTATVTITGATEAQLNSRLQALTVSYPDPTGSATAADWNGSFTVT
ncbi:hypothetical protein, partial [Chromatium okenii]|uniref:hypothetical protein n=1 Tax=Chromatium okenii TaxID=61644 RepID=UPI0026EEAE02